MAKTYKKKQDNFLRNVLIGFGSVFVVLFAVMLYFNITELKYDDFEQVGTYDDVAKMPEDVYAVYYYSTSCGACNTIKSTVLDFAEENALGLKVYMLGHEQTSEVIPGARSRILDPAGPTETTTGYLSSTPTLIVFQDGEIIEFIIGGNNIPDFIESVNNGSYTFDE